jgi:hypothetical protein
MLIIYTLDFSLVPEVIPRYVKEEEGLESGNTTKNDLLLFDKKVTMAVEGLQPSSDKILEFVSGYYDIGEWKEKKIAPDKWKFTYSVKKQEHGKKET